MPPSMRFLEAAQTGSSCLINSPSPPAASTQRPPPSLPVWFEVFDFVGIRGWIVHELRFIQVDLDLETEPGRTTHGVPTCPHWTRSAK